MEHRITRNRALRLSFGSNSNIGATCKLLLFNQTEHKDRRRKRVITHFMLQMTQLFQPPETDIKRHPDE
jgi:hypothetical protein